jgi:hypothetical protein
VTPNSYVLLHSPLTRPVAWRRLPTLLSEHGYHVIVINVQDDDEAPFAERYDAGSGPNLRGESAPPTVFVAHSGAGPLLPAMTANLPDAWRTPGGYVSSTPAFRRWRNHPDSSCFVRKTATLRRSYGTR